MESTLYEQWETEGQRELRLPQPPHDAPSHSHPELSGLRVVSFFLPSQHWAPYQRNALKRNRNWVLGVCVEGRWGGHSNLYEKAFSSLLFSSRSYISIHLQGNKMLKTWRSSKMAKRRAKSFQWTQCALHSTKVIWLGVCQRFRRKIRIVS